MGHRIGVFQRWPFRAAALSVVIACVGLALTNCTSVDKLYRPLPMISQGGCIGIDELIDRERNKANAHYLQRVQISTFRGDVSCSDSNSYLLSFLEVSETTDALLKSDQLTDLEGMIRDRDVYIVAFVHGWRIDAGNNSSDLAKFHIYLHYARNYLNQRCHDAARYCDTDLVGVFVSWRGRSFDEPHIGFDIVRDNARKPFVFTAGAAPTIWDRKRQSEKHASTVIGLLRRLQSHLTLDGPAGTGDRMLVMGHSLGGNMLATGIRQAASEAIDDHVTGTVMPPLLGNLLLLINPAAEAEKWTDLQRRMRRKAGVPLERGADTSADPNLRWAGMFPKSQKPVYMAMTSPCEWSQIWGT